MSPTVDIDISEGDPGLKEDHPIEIDSDDEEEPSVVSAPVPRANPPDAARLAVLAAIEVRNDADYT
jgi:hypothetical protein